MLQLKAKTDGHEMYITEHCPPGLGVISLDFFCRSCDSGETFEKEDFPKYRLAMAAAQNAAEDHVGAPVKFSLAL